MTWIDRAACNGLDTELFYDTHIKAQIAAKAVCARCPVLAECHDAWVALDRYARSHGIWFGTTPSQRERNRMGRVCDDCRRSLTYKGRIWVCRDCLDIRRRQQWAAYEQKRERRG